jgi:hypothetical protein
VHSRKLSPGYKRKPYSQPALTSVHPQEAQYLLEMYADRDDENTRALLRQARIHRSHDVRQRGELYEVRVAQPSLLRRVVLAATIAFLCLVPLTLLIVAVSAGSVLRIAFAKLSLLWFPVWMTFTLWVTLDAAALFGFAGPRPDPLGPKALSMSALGIANILSMIAFLFLVKTA